MNDKKSSISGEHKLNLTISGMTNDELIEKGKKKWDPSSSPASIRPPTVPPHRQTTTTTTTVKQEELTNASNSLVNASDSIVDGVLLVIGALEEQNKYQQTANNNLDKIIRDLTTIHVEMIKTRNDNHSVKKIMIAVLIGMMFTIIISTYTIKSNFDQAKLNNDRTDKFQEQLEKAIDVAEEAKRITIAAAQFSQNKSEVVILPADGKDGAYLEISQPVKQKTAGNVIITERDVVRVPISLKDAQIRPSVTTIMDETLRRPTIIEHEEKMEKKD